MYKGVGAHFVDFISFSQISVFKNGGLGGGFK